MAVGFSVTSVFGGPADRSQYGEVSDFIAAKVPRVPFTPDQLELHQNYQKLRDLRESQISGVELESEIQNLIERHQRKFPQDWLLLLEAVKLAQNVDFHTHVDLKIGRASLGLCSKKLREKTPDRRWALALEPTVAQTNLRKADLAFRENCRCKR